MKKTGKELEEELMKSLDRIDDKDKTQKMGNIIDIQKEVIESMQRTINCLIELVT